LISSSAAIAEPGELLKNVRSFFKADRLASSGVTAGKRHGAGRRLAAEKTAIHHDVRAYARWRPPVPPAAPI
jgi:hypothetical protein